MEKQRDGREKTVSYPSIPLGKEVQMYVTAQEAFCQKVRAPMFAPKSGVCPYCAREIFGGEGYAMSYAGRQLITGCPFCSRSFCD